ncbi:MAG: DoxX family protein [Parcubacteria group bacterium]|nr:DoxX family protein [Parcubacteria group bacterium]
MRKSTSFSGFSRAMMPEGFAWAGLLLRISIGVLFFTAGWEKFTAEGGWSAAGYLSGATGPFAEFFQSMAGNGFIDQLNIWGLMLIGLGLIFGMFMRPAALSGILLMLLYYFAGFESNTAHGIIDEHIMYSLVFVLFITGGFGHVLGLDGLLERRFEKAGKWTKWLFG